MAEKKRKSRYAVKLVKRKQLSGARGSTTVKGKHLPIPLSLFKDTDED